MFFLIGDSDGVPSLVDELVCLILFSLLVGSNSIFCVLVCFHYHWLMNCFFFLSLIVGQRTKWLSFCIE